MRLTTGEITEMVAGRLEGDPALVITRMASLDTGDANSLSFLQKARFLPQVYDTLCAAIIVTDDFEPQSAIKPALIRVADPYKSFIGLLIKQYPPNGHQHAGVDATAVVCKSAKLGKDVFIGANCYIGEGVVLNDYVQVHPNSYIGDGCRLGVGSVLHPNVTLYHGTILGQHCTIHAGSVLGSDGFGYIPEQGKLTKVPQIGNVVIGDHVEIGANCSIDRATIGSTTVGDGTKIDNQVHIAHNIEIGKHCVLAAQVGVAGSVRMGDHVMLGGQVGITGHIDIADGVQVGGMSGLSKTVRKKGAQMRGVPARDFREQLKIEALAIRLPEIFARVKELEDLIKTLQPEQPGQDTPPPAAP
jgi:UDP-3-O-[3-hydroxymyristoyl] glucosamine N-acyltransferase